MNPLTSTLLALGSSAAGGLSSLAARSERAGRSAEPDAAQGFARLLDRSRERMAAPAQTAPATPIAERAATPAAREPNPAPERDAGVRPPTERALAERQATRREEARTLDRRQADERSATAERRQTAAAEAPAPASPAAPDGRALASRTARGGSSRTAKPERSDPGRTGAEGQEVGASDGALDARRPVGASRSDGTERQTAGGRADDASTAAAAGGSGLPAGVNAPVPEPGSVGLSKGSMPLEGVTGEGSGDGRGVGATASDPLISGARETAAGLTSLGPDATDGNRSDAQTALQPHAGAAARAHLAASGHGPGSAHALRSEDEPAGGLRVGPASHARDELALQGAVPDRLNGLTTDRLDALLGLAGSPHPTAPGSLHGAAAAGLAAPLAAAGDPGASATLPSVDVADRMDTPGFAPSLASQVSVLARDGIERAEIRLNPAEMGPVAVQILIDGSQARVEFTADQAVTRQALESSLPQLAAALREAGLTLSGGGVFQQGGRSGSDGGGRPGSGSERDQPSEGASEGGTPTLGHLSGSRRALPGGVDVYA